MKKINTFLGTDPNGQQPFTAPSLLFLQQAYQEAIDAICRSKGFLQTKIYVLYGCVNSTFGGSTFTISAGAVYYAGEIFLVDAVTFTQAMGQTAVGSLVVTNPAPDPTTFEDGINRNVHDVRKIVVASGVSGTGITGNSNSDFNNWINEQWNVVGTTGQPAFANSWDNDAPTTTTSLSFRINGRKLLFKGVIAGGTSGTSPVNAALGAMFRPVKNTIFSLTADTTHVAQGSLLSDGTLAITYEAGASFVSFDGVEISLD